MRQKHGQNFLTDKNIARKIVAAADIKPSDSVLEIGPGKGVLTEIIAQKADEVVAVELDRVLAERLKTRFSSLPNLRIIDQDFMDFSFPEKKGFKIVANLPYNMATAIIQKFLPSRAWENAVVMVQKEVGERITAKPRSKIYGALTLFCQYFAEGKVLFSVSPSCFSPAPKVDSVVISLTNLFKAPNKLLFDVISLSFQQRRKVILNSLSHGLDVSKSRLAEVFEKAGVDPSLRPEYLTLDNFKDLTSALIYYRILKEKN